MSRNLRGRVERLERGRPPGGQMPWEFIAGGVPWEAVPAANQQFLLRVLEELEDEPEPDRVEQRIQAALEAGEPQPGLKELSPAGGLIQLPVPDVTTNGPLREEGTGHE